MMQQIKITILYSYLTINKWEYLLNITPNKTVLPATGQKELILVVFTMFKVSKSFFADFDVLFWNQPINHWEKEC